ncbi:prenyltransferase [Corynebacterium sp. ZY180755]
MTTLKAVLAASRPISWVNTAFPFGAAYIIAGGQIDWLWIVGVIFFLIPYNIAMYGINDVFDYESDIRNPRKGGVEGAVLSKALHPALLWSSGLSVAPFAAILYWQGNLVSNLWLTFSLFMVLAYSFKGLRFKERPMLDSITSSVHFVSPALVGATLVSTALSTHFWMGISAFFLWGMASHALGAVQDVKADREGGLSSIATAFGARATTRLAALFYLAAAILLFLLPGFAWVVGIFALGYVANTARYWNITDETCEEANKSWRVFLWLNYLSGAAVTISLWAGGAFATALG